MSYTPPAGNAAQIKFKGYSPPLGSDAEINFAGGDEIQPAGFETSVFGSPVVGYYIRYVAPASLSQSAFGVASIHRNVKTTGIHLSTFGLADFYTTGQQRIATDGYSVYAGVAPYGVVVSHKNRDISQSGGFNASLFGTPSTSQNGTTISPLGLATIFGQNQVAHKNRSFALTGFDASLFGTTKVWVRQSVACAGFDSFVCGVGAEQYDDRMKVTNVLDTQIVASTGFCGFASNIHAVSFRNQQIVAPHTTPTRFGTTVLSYYGANTVDVSGQPMSLFGTTGVGRRFNFEGVSCSGYGTATASYSDGSEFVCGTNPRAIPPQGFIQTEFGMSEVGNG